MKFIVIHEDRDFDDVDEQDEYEAQSVAAAAIMDVDKSFQYISENDGNAVDKYAIDCILEGEPDEDVRLVKDELGVVYRVIVHNYPITINIMNEPGKRTSWSRVVAGMEVIS